MSGIERTAIVAASPAQVWEVLADFGEISAWVPMIQHSCLLSDQTEHPGTIRRVQIARQTLVETVVTWRPGTELAYDIAGLPPIVGTARNTWRLTPTADGTEVVLSTEIVTGHNPVRSFAAKKALERMSLASEMMLAGLTARLSPTKEPS